MTGRPDVLVAHQPAYLPWPGYFSRLLDAGRFVVLDHVQFAERGRHHRNYLRDRAGRSVRLTVPVRRSFGQPLTAVRIADDQWRARHWRSLRETYGKAPYWPLYADRFHAIYDRHWDLLVDLNLAVVDLCLGAFGLDVTVVRSSRLGPVGQKNDMLLDLCRLTGARVLRVGTGALRYLDAARLGDAGVTVEVATYAEHRPSVGTTHMPSAVDLLVKHGPGARELLITNCRVDPWPRSAVP